ncbi:hypothetical protein MKK63_30865 [Methylobacterium sp. J-088]|uniref:hypothetical protein n=1 Tax=Methylobacterium sp. J-088 TaxID=2836664 RepID=UPI001FBC0052|nr:hypothetical protein [Methylobacterium sp. J-088]MCJ2067059.1 hypothetical protein [Methylobacterium sp. J-088]
MRLFMSVDLVGSTAFKAKHSDRRDGDEPYPVWLNRTRSFYRQFPQIIDNLFAEYSGILDGREAFKHRSPKVWKTVGDEIIFCIRIVCLEHLACCIRSFVKALSAYGDLINSQEPELDVKGCAWVASFPAPNATVTSASRFSIQQTESQVGDQLEEKDEQEADINPGEYDFLGKQIDTGFRISKFAQAHELALSIDLAWLLTLLRQRDLVDCQFTYRGKEALKGVIGGAPYPIITVQTERSTDKRELDSLERTVAGVSFAEPISLRNYLHSFMVQNKVEIPIVVLHHDKIDEAKLPKCYDALKAAWGLGEREDAEREKAKQEANDYDDDVARELSTPETPGTPAPALDPAPTPASAEPSNIGEINLTIDRMIDEYWSSGKW